jgi:hypothetical protein
MYHYWKTGAISGKYMRDKEWIKKVKDIDFENFINLIDKKIHYYFIHLHGINILHHILNG